MASIEGTTSESKGMISPVADRALPPPEPPALTEPKAELHRLVRSADLGTEARIVLDAAPEYVIPAAVSFVASRAQFTPKQVETRSARERLSFRVKLQIAPELLSRYEPLVKTGVPGIGYVRLDPEVDWPQHLQPRLPPWKQGDPNPSSS